MRGDDLCLFYADKNKVKNAVTDGTQYALYYLTRGQKDGVKIPLAFDLKLIKNPLLARVMPPGAGFHATDYGLIFGQSMRGFWVIPWSDIDAYRAKAHPAAAPALPPNPSGK